MTTILEGLLQNRLCNKMFGLFELCERAKIKNTDILEPIFGWKKPVLFTEIFDIEYFNDTMQEVKMIPRSLSSGYSIEDSGGTWIQAAATWKKYRDLNSIPIDSMYFQVLKSLKLNKKHEAKTSFIKNIDELDAVHLRIEKDWERYLKNGPPQLNGQKAETNFLVETQTFIRMYKDFTGNRNILLSTGENHKDISDKFAKNEIKAVFYFDSSVEYEISAAINFFLCSKCKNFIGITRSTFSNLVSLLRHINGKDNSYIYNYGDRIHERVDIGLQQDPKLAVNKKIHVKV